MDLAPVALSLRVASLATVLTITVGVPTAWILARRTFPGKDLLSATLLMVVGVPV